mgnify:FL=1|tara:strand:+ start:486 stop:1040 length:555 start_codon:yes stop_codon:yes gene_type:complete
MATVYEIVQGLAQAAANAYDGALDEKGEMLEAGLQREEGNPILDKRVMDGFNVKFYGDKMCLSYQSDVQLKEVYANGFETDIERRVADIAKFLKKEYKKITGNAVTLTKEGEIDVRVENSSRVRSWVTAKMHYKIGGLDESMEIDASSENRVEASWKKFLDLGGWQGKRPDNDSRKKGSEVEKK